MRRVALTPDIQTSALGFGCASVLGARSAQESAFALDRAFALGVRHFDLAPSYGFGQAEAFVGKQLANRRDQITITTKFGIQPNWKARVLQPLKPVVRRVKRWLPTNGVTIPTNPAPAASPTATGPFLNRVEMTGPALRLSLENSLRRLRTDYVDCLFLHEAPAGLDRWDELLEVADELRRAGKIKAFGTAGYDAQPRQDLPVLWQTCAPTDPTAYQRLATASSKPTVLFSPLSAAVCPERPTARLGQVFMDFPDSVILCSMFSEKHLLANVTAANLPTT